jgi:hypothetical protein
LTFFRIKFKKSMDIFIENSIFFNFSKDLVIIIFDMELTIFKPVSSKVRKVQNDLALEKNLHGNLVSYFSQESYDYPYFHFPADHSPVDHLYFSKLHFPVSHVSQCISPSHISPSHISPYHIIKILKNS